jgi:hypothetical protein
MTTITRIAAALAALAMMSTSAHAALLSRASGAAYYDDVLDITWLADANLVASNTFGVTGIDPAGYMTWAEAGEWIAAMNTANYLGVNTWRLPTVTDTGTPGCDYAYTGTDCGFNVDLSTGEMAHMFYSTLGNLGYYDTSGSGPQPGWGLSNTGPFSNLQPYFYWSGTTLAPSPSNAWYFRFIVGSQVTDGKGFSFYAWAVSSGDSAAVPVPGAVWLFGTALVSVGRALRRRVLNRTAA